MFLANLYKATWEKTKDEWTNVWGN
jgi:hypothetical protein